MRYVCPLCAQTSLDRNLWCQEKTCPAETIPAVLERGEWVGDLEVLEPVAILRTCAIYRAQRGREMVWLKLAYAADADRARLEREGHALLQLAPRRHPMLPELLPAHSGARLVDHPVGRAVFRGRPVTFLVMRAQEGVLLRDLLLRNPQPWHHHVGWLIISLADALAALHALGRLHLTLCPESVVVRYDSRGVPRPVLIDLGMACTAEQLASAWSPGRLPAPPAYLAPELFDRRGRAGPTADVYALGLLLYEMLQGAPAYPIRLLRDEVVARGVQKRRLAPLVREDLRALPEIAMRAIAQETSNRPPTMLALERELQAYFPVIPPERRPFQVDWRAAAVVGGVALCLALLLALAIALS